jgi:hypothetical protein
MVAARLWTRIPFRIAVGSQMGVCWKGADTGSSIREKGGLQSGRLWGRPVPGASVGSLSRAPSAPKGPQSRHQSAPVALVCVRFAVGGRWGRSCPSPSSRPNVLSPDIKRHPWLTPDWV